MFARTVSFRLKPNMLSDYSRTFDKDILPLLRKQNGFKDEINISPAPGESTSRPSACGTTKPAQKRTTPILTPKC